MSRNILNFYIKFLQYLFVLLTLSLIHISDANGNVDIGAAVDDGAVKEIGTVKDENTGNSTTIYGSEGTMSKEEAVESGIVTEEEAASDLDWLLN